MSDPNLNIFEPISSDSMNIINELSSLSGLSDKITGYNNTTKNIKTELKNQIESIDKTLENVKSTFDKINEKCNNATKEFKTALQGSQKKHKENVKTLEEQIKKLVNMDDLKKSIGDLSTYTKDLVNQVANADNSVDASELFVESQTQQKSNVGATSVQETSPAPVQATSTDNTESIQADLLAQQEKAAAEAETKRLAEEKAAAEAETKRLAEEKAAAEAETKRLEEEKAAAEAEKAAAKANEQAATEAENAADIDEANFRNVTDEQAAAEANEQAAAQANVTPSQTIIKKLKLKDNNGNLVNTAKQLVNLTGNELETAKTAIEKLFPNDKTTLANAIKNLNTQNQVMQLNNLKKIGILRGGKRKKKTQKKKKRSKKRNHKITFRKKKKSIKRK